MVSNLKGCLSGLVVRAPDSGWNQAFESTDCMQEGEGSSKPS